MTFFSFWVDVSFNTVLETLQSVSNEAEQNFKVECFFNTINNFCKIQVLNFKTSQTPLSSRPQLFSLHYHLFFLCDRSVGVSVNKCQCKL